ncbi:hypothetical protein BC833DRAFT_618694 [Globomyces pollinis-pini]|nr:hypothetical protein BC833DRAFT_618694 [Globomyces pollinis-pini]
MDPKDEIVPPQHHARKARLEAMDNIQNRVIGEGLKSAGLFGMAGLLGHYILNKSSPFYLRQRSSHKLFVLLMIPTAAFFTKTDTEAMKADREFASQFSITHEHPVEKEYQVDQNGIRNFILDNKFKLVGYGWLSVMGLSLVYNFSRPQIRTAQKFINARMVAQTSALVSMVSIAMLSGIAKESKPPVVVRDEHFESIINQK